MVDLKKTFNGDGPGMVKPLKNHRWQWCLGKKTLPFHRSKKMTIVEVYSTPSTHFLKKRLQIDIFKRLRCLVTQPVKLRWKSYRKC